MASRPTKKGNREANALLENEIKEEKINAQMKEEIAAEMATVEIENETAVNVTVGDNPPSDNAVEDEASVAYTHVPEAMCDLIDNTNMEETWIRFEEKRQNVKIIIEDLNHGIADLFKMMVSGCKNGLGFLNNHGKGVKLALLFLTLVTKFFIIDTKTDDDIKQGIFHRYMSPYKYYGKEVKSIPLQKWKGIHLLKAGTRIEILVDKRSFLQTENLVIQKASDDACGTFQSTVETIKEYLAVTYDKSLNDTFMLHLSAKDVDGNELYEDDERILPIDESKYVEKYIGPVNKFCVIPGVPGKYLFPIDVIDPYTGEHLTGKVLITGIQKKDGNGVRTIFAFRRNRLQQGIFFYVRENASSEEEVKERLLLSGYVNNSWCHHSNTKDDINGFMVKVVYIPDNKESMVKTKVNKSKIDERDVVFPKILDIVGSLYREPERYMTKKFKTNEVELCKIAAKRMEETGTAPFLEKLFPSETFLCANTELHVFTCYQEEDTDIEEKHLPRVDIAVETTNGSILLEAKKKQDENDALRELRDYIEGYQADFGKLPLGACVVLPSEPNSFVKKRFLDLEKATSVPIFFISWEDISIYKEDFTYVSTIK